MRLAIAVFLTLSAAMLASGISVGLAESVDEDDAETLIAMLQPGDNFVGWVGEPLPITELFAEYPQIELISAWDALAQRVGTAYRGQSAAEQILSTLEPGAAYVIRIGADEMVEWNRSAVPAAGRIQLRTGENWVAWLGPDDWTVEDVAKGVGQSLLEIRLGERVYRPANPDSAKDWPTIARGEGLIVTVARDVTWLQPTFVMPQIHYAGNVDHGRRRLIDRDLTATLEYSAREFGVQADPFSLVVVVASGAKAAHDMTTELGRDWTWEAFRNFWPRGNGWYISAQDAFYLKTSTWEGYRSGRYYRGRYIVLHEYIHALQYQSVGEPNSLYPKWLLEGSANWFDIDLSTLDRNGYPLSRHLINALNQASKGPPLEEIESSNKTWQYSFGLVAANLLVERSGKSAVLDFYRALAPGRAGPGGHWTTRPTMRSAFAAAFELTLDEFYEEFETLLAKRRGSARRRPAGNEVTLTGTIVNSDGTPRVDATLEAREYKDGHPAGWNRRAKSTQDGTFEIFIRKRANYQVWIELGDHRSCGFWWSTNSDRAQPSEDEARVIETESSEPDGITITVDADRCRWRISGTLSGPDDEPLAGIEVRAQGEDSSSSVRTELDGSFTLITTAPGSFQLSVDLGGCVVDWRNAEDTEAGEQASLIEVLDSDISGINFQVLEDPCARISGRLLDSEGNGIGRSNVYAKAVGPRAASRTSSDGSFTLATTEQGDHRLYAYVDGCRILYQDEGLTGVWSDAIQIPVSQGEIFPVIMQLPTDMCRSRISGRLLNPDGTPRTGIYVRGTSDSGSGGDWPAEDGTFSFAVPDSGTYKLSVTIEGCQVFHVGDDTVGIETEARSFVISSADITGIEFRLPEDPASVCNEAD